MTLKPICVKCQRFYRPSHNGRWFVEGKPRYPRALPGTQEPQSWEPYKLWQGDEWRCEGCDNKIIVGVGWRPYSEHYKPGFMEAVVATNASLQINDC